MVPGGFRALQMGFAGTTRGQQNNFLGFSGGHATFRKYFPQSVNIVSVVMFVVMQALCCEFKRFLSRITA